jgi:ribosome silencing factor RsfS/YbeB/iojap
VTASPRAVELAIVAAEAAADKLADDIVAFDVSDQLVITDVFVLCSAPNDRQVRAIIDEVEERLRRAGAKPVRREGEREGRWVLLDYVDIVVHVQHGEERTFYALERPCRPVRVTTSAEQGRPEVDAVTGAGLGVRLVFWRHGRTEWNAGGRFQGQTDVDLDETGVAQADRAARLLASLRPQLIVSSDLRRAANTAAPLARLSRLEVRLEPALRERSGGWWEGLTGAEIGERFPANYAAWRRGEDVSPDGGESSQEVATRVVGAVEKAVADLADGGVGVVVTHGGAARVGIGRLLGLPPERWSALGALSNCCWSVVGRRDGRWRLLEHNAGTLPEPVLGDDS